MSTHTLHNHPLELRVIGTAFSSRDAATAYVVEHRITETHFTIDAHRTLWNVVAERLEADAVLDEIILADVLARRPELLAGNVDLETVFATLAHAYDHAEAERNDEHATVLRDLAERRRLVAGLDHAQRRLVQLDHPVDETVTLLTETAFGAESGRSDPRVTSVREGLFRRLDHWEQPGPNPGYALGFHGLDKVMSLRPGTVTVIAARPSIGKSLFAQQVISTVVHRHPVRAVLVSLEMDANELLDRIVPYEAHVPGAWLARAPKRPGEHEAAWRRVLDVADDEALDRYGYVDDVDLAIPDIVALARRQRAQHPDFGLLVVDYLGLVRATDPRQLPVHAIAEISRQLKVVAITLGIAVIALSQLNRGPEADRRPPRLSDLRDSGAIEQDADHVLFLHADPGLAAFGPDAPPTAATEVIVAKNRSGPRGSRVPLGFDGSIPRFVDESVPAGVAGDPIGARA